jgi:hypothetical protein
MTATVRTIEPTQITTREAVHWTKSYSDYPASLWNLNYYFRGPGTGFDALWATEVTADGDDFDILVPADTTDNVTVAGLYTWQAWVTEDADTDNVIMVGSGRTKIVIGFDPASVTTVETRTPAKIMLDTIDAALLAFNGENVQEYEITTPAGSRRVKRGDQDKLREDRKYWATIVTNEYARENARNGKPVMTNIQMRVYDE